MEVVVGGREQELGMVGVEVGGKEQELGDRGQV